MKHRASLVLMEQLVMILIFALAAGVCLQLFAAADGVARETEQLDRAVVLAQNGAEAVKTCGGDLAAAEALLGAGEDDLLLEMTNRDSGVAGLGKTQVEVTQISTGEILFSLTVFWQEVGQ